MFSFFCYAVLSVLSRYVIISSERAEGWLVALL